MQEFKQWLTELVVHEDVNLSSSTSLSCAPRQMAMVDDRAEHFRHARSSDVGAQAQMTKRETSSIRGRLQRREQTCGSIKIFMSWHMQHFAYFPRKPPLSITRQNYVEHQHTIMQQILAANTDTSPCLRILSGQALSADSLQFFNFDMFSKAIKLINASEKDNQSLSQNL